MFVGCDVGGSSSSAVLADSDGAIVRRSHGDAANPHIVGFDASAALIVKLIGTVISSNVKAVAVCVSGGESADICSRYKQEIRRSLRLEDAVEVLVTHNVVAPLGLILCQTPCRHAPMAVVIAGTGSVAASFSTRSATAEACFQGKSFAIQMTRRCGGWGPLLGDAGSAFAIATSALSLALRIWDGMPVSDSTARRPFGTGCSDNAMAILRTALQHYCPGHHADIEAESLASLVSFIYDKSTTRGVIASLAPKLATLATEGNQLCARVFGQAGRDIGELLAAALEPENAMKTLDYSEAIVCAVGGVFAGWHQVPDFSHGFCSSLRDCLRAGGRVSVLQHVCDGDEDAPSSTMAYACAHLGAISVGCSNANWVRHAHSHLQVVTENKELMSASA